MLRARRSTTDAKSPRVERRSVPADAGTIEGTLLRSIWPSSTPKRDVAGLPALAAEALGLGGRRGALLRGVAAALDRTIAAWPEQAAADIAAAAEVGFTENARRLAAALSQRQIRSPETLIETAVQTGEPERKLWVLVGLSGTDTAAVRSFWTDALRGRANDVGRHPDPAFWYAFLRAFHGGWLSYSDFRDCLVQGHVLNAVDSAESYARAVKKVGLAAHPTFAKWYRQIVYEVAHQPDVALSYGGAGWVRDFPGEDYFWQGLSALSRKPDDWLALQVVRYASGVKAQGPEFASRLRGAPALTLCLLSLLRPDLCSAAGEALSAPVHDQAIAWLTSESPDRVPDLRWMETKLRPWAEHVGEAMTLACGALCSVDLPSDYPGPDEAILRRREFACQLVPEFDRVMENVLYLHALRREHLDILYQRARDGRIAAIRALALWPEKAAESAPLLFSICRRGTKGASRAASESLEILRARARVGGLAELEKRVDLAMAWADAGMEGKPARVWWDVQGYRMRLSVAAGKVAVCAFSGARRLAGIPKAARDAPEYEEIRRTRAELARCYQYFRERLESAMVEGVCYSGGEFASLLANPVVRSLVSRLVVVVDGRARMWSPADPLAEDAPPIEFAGAGEVMIAHPVTLAGMGALDEWQQRVIDGMVSQPFKQVFREVYRVERGDAAESGRFAGHALVARNAFALLRSRGYSPGRGEAVKRWQGGDGGVEAHVQWAAEHEDAGRLLALSTTSETVTSGAVWFVNASGERLRLGTVEPVIFSETHRDADLLVSRAAAGEFGFSSQETLRLRATLIRYLARVIGATNIYVIDDEQYALVEGTRAMYRVNLGSGSVLLEERRQHIDMGEFQSPPVGDLVVEGMDAGTARVLATIVTLARDGAITDERFLRQLTTGL